ncbi:MAG TPA: 30S ribosomal protein S20 [Phycisphaerae bacterium]|nr:30S ribosomal protein S20 [Phycisphaerae bacterium]
MPHSLSARKRVRQNTRCHERNRAIKSRIRTARRAFLNAVDAGDLDAAGQRLRAAERLLHRAANNGPIHRNLAAREIGRLQQRLNAAAALK